MSTPLLRYDEQELVGRLSQISAVARSIFAAACAQRLFPLYEWFHQQTGRGEPGALEAALSSLWLYLEGESVNDLAAYQEVAEALVPPEDETWIDECAYAQNSAAAVAYAVRSVTNGDAQDAVWAARQVYEALDFLITTRDNVDLNEAGVEDRIAADPLVQKELGRQIECVEQLVEVPGPELTAVASKIREKALADAPDTVELDWN